MGELFEPICIGYFMEGASPPEMISCKHSDIQAEVEEQLLVADLKNTRLEFPGQDFSSTK